MKYIKTYEEIKKPYNRKLFWTIPTDDRYIASLKKIGCLNDNLYVINPNTDSLLDIDKYMSNPNNKYILISYDNDDEYGEYSEWSWMPYTSSEFYLNSGYKYAGLVNIDESEMLSPKYNL